MRRLFALTASMVVTVALPLLAQNQSGGLGEVNALGQSVRRPAAPAGPTPRLPDGTVDLNGLWVGGGAVGDMERDGGLKPGEVPLLPAAKALRDSRKEPDEPYLYCMPQGAVRAQPYPWRFVQNYTHKAATHLFKLEEGNIHSYRQIFMDGRKHPAELDPTWFGHSIGHWEGDTLVVDTIGFNDKFWFDRRGHPHTEQLHVIERFTRKDMGHMEIKITVDDPGAYSRPFTLTFNARLSNPGDELMEYVCQENNQYGIAGGHPNPLAEPAK
ncbi:MAG: hypothetical protein HOP16_18240 [Acidobacteria bacterium]|nr:hypothetical protein [Acidobacteriota bacterium]